MTMTTTIPEEDSIRMMEEMDASFVDEGDNERKGDGAENDSAKVQLAKGEERAVFCSRVVLIFALLAALAAVSMATYFITKRNEKEDFEAAFLTYAKQIVSAAELNAQTTIATVAAFSATVSNLALASAPSVEVNGTSLHTSNPWPFVTLPDFAASAARINDLVTADGTLLLTLVDDKDRNVWIDYATDQKPLVYKQNIDQEPDLNMTLDEIIEQSATNITRLNLTGPKITFDSEDRPGPYPVVWQTSPLLLNKLLFTNYNMGDSPRVIRGFKTAYQTKAISVSEVLTAKKDNPGEFVPKTQILQPVFDKPYKGYGPKDDLQVVGGLWLQADWKNYFLNLLPDGTNGIYVVFQSYCSAGEDKHVVDGHYGPSTIGYKYTYQINGADAIAVGEGDLHDPVYDYLGETAPFFDVDYDPTLLDNETCAITLRISVYPSQEFEESFQTNDVVVFTCSVAAIMAFTVLLFGLYDCSVRRRQQKVMKRVTKQHQIVSDLFPTNFRDKLYADESESNGGSDGHQPHTRLSRRKVPLAELYPSTTIFFGDLVNFTQWSSEREPSEVFALLETIYGTFDRVAAKFSIFKVETVGDCYVAIAGCPEPMEAHAVAAARFARGCVNHMKNLTSRLEEQLGPDTRNLALRVGLHSGPVTGGLLRGDRSRFQLYGDSMNTASRMESTSDRYQIQISSTTAELLKRFNKERWIRPREGRVFIKGKGEMETYWLDTNLENKSVVSEESYREVFNSAYRERKLETAPESALATAVQTSSNEESTGHITETESV